MIEAIIFDYARTLVDIDTTPPTLFPNTEEVLQQLKGRGLKLALVSRGQDPDSRQREFEHLRLDRFFDVFRVVGPKGTKDFRPLIDELRGADLFI